MTRSALLRDSRPSDWSPGWLTPPRWSTRRRPERETYGGVAARIAEKIGLPLMPWQRHVVDIALEVDPDTGLLAYRQVMVTLPRQGGKSSLMLVLMLARCVVAGERQMIVYTAQDGKAAGEKFEEDFVERLRTTKGLAEGREFQARLGNGKERILWLSNRSIMRPSATTPKSGHGRTLDLGLIDEAFAHKDMRVDQSFGPPMLTRPEPQLWIVSTAGTWSSVYFNAKRAAGRSSVEADDPGAARFAYFEWSADEDDADLFDRELWWRVHTALGHTITEDALAAEIEKMIADPDLGEAEARRAYLNITVPDPGEVDDSALDLDAWEAQVDDRSGIDGRLVLGVAVSPDRSRGAIAAAGRRPDGDAHVETVETGEGAGWIVERLAERVAEVASSNPVAGVAIDAGGPAGSLLADVAAAGLPVLKMSGRDYAQACGALYDRVGSREVWHLGTPDLDDAVAGAKTRPLGDAWAFDRKRSDVDITPLEAATLALGSLLALPEESEPGETIYAERGFFEL